MNNTTEAQRQARDVARDMTDEELIQDLLDLGGRISTEGFSRYRDVVNATRNEVLERMRS